MLQTQVTNPDVATFQSFSKGVYVSYEWLRADERVNSQVDVGESLPFLQLQFATTLPPVLPLTEDVDRHQELYEAEEQFGKVVKLPLLVQRF